MELGSFRQGIGLFCRLPRLVAGVIWRYRAEFLGRFAEAGFWERVARPWQGGGIWLMG